MVASPAPPSGATGTFRILRLLSGARLDNMSETGTQVLALLRAQDPQAIEGGVIRRMFYPSERYVIDFDRDMRREWKQYDTDHDASYFGTWVNLATREVLTYAEGDWSISTLATPEDFRADLARMAEFYGAPPPAIVAYDMDGTRTEYYDTRPSAEEVTP